MYKIKQSAEMRQINHELECVVVEFVQFNTAGTEVMKVLLFVRRHSY